MARIDPVLSERIRQLAIQHGGLRAAGRALKVDHAYLWCIAAGKKKPSTQVLCTTDDPSLVIVLPPQAIKGRRTFKLLVGTTPDKRRSMLWRYLERWDLL